MRTRASTRRSRRSRRLASPPRSTTTGSPSRRSARGVGRVSGTVHPLVSPTFPSNSCYRSASWPRSRCTSRSYWPTRSRRSRGSRYSSRAATPIIRSSLCRTHARSAYSASVALVTGRCHFTWTGGYMCGSLWLHSESKCRSSLGHPCQYSSYGYRRPRRFQRAWPYSLGSDAPFSTSLCCFPDASR